jgi:hypothetical protein
MIRGIGYKIHYDNDFSGKIMIKYLYPIEDDDICQLLNKKV